MTDRINEQPVRVFLLGCFQKSPPFWFRPQPSIIIIDHTEALLKKYRAEFLDEIYDLCLICQANPAKLQFFFILDSIEGVCSLKALNGGDLFTEIANPEPKDDGSKYHENLTKMHGNFRITNSYLERSADEKGNPEDFYKTKMETYRELHNIMKAVTTKKIIELRKAYLDILYRGSEIAKRKSE